jgi:Cytosolic domain of 10TM putative phosphate transporter
MLTVEKLTEVFGPHVEKVWINRDYKELQDLVDERNEDAILLENAETKLIKTVNKVAIKKGKKDVPENYDKSITTLYIKDKKRPHNRLGYPVINLVFGKKVKSPILFANFRLIVLTGPERSLHASILKSPRNKTTLQVTKRLAQLSSRSRLSQQPIALRKSTFPRRSTSLSNLKERLHHNPLKSFGLICVSHTLNVLLGLQGPLVSLPS